MSRKKLYYSIMSIPIILILLISFTLFYINKIKMNDVTDIHQQYIKDDFINDNKNILKEKISGLEKIISFESSQIENLLQEDLKDKINMALTLANKTYNNYKDSLSKEELRKLIIQNISNLRFYEDRGYFYVLDAKTDVVVGHPTLKFIGKSFAGFKDATGQAPIQKQKAMLKNSKDNLVYLKLYFYRPHDDKKMFPKLVASAIFEPFNLFIGTGEYLDVIEKRIKTKVIDEVNDLNQIILTEKIDIYEIKDLNSLENKPLLLNSKKLNKEVIENKDKLLNQLKNANNAMISYKSFDETLQKTVIKHQYFYYHKEWNWLITTHFSETDILKSINNLNEITNSKYEELKETNQITTAIVILILLVISIYVFSKFSQLIQKYTKTIETKNKQLEENQILLEEKIKKAVEENREKELKLFEQSKIADMARMMSNIAHQWRQPLSVISTAASSLKLKQMINKLDESFLESSIKSINESVYYLSNTIDIFSNVVKSEKNYDEVIIQNTIKKTLDIYKKTLEDNNIILQNNINEDTPFTPTLDEGEFSQVLINIMNNSLDIIEERKIEKPVITTELSTKEDSIVLTIEDNAGGIDKNVISKIFEPYFTTKHESQGTGLGLHLSYKIITENLKGKLYVKNTKDGAKFFIEIPFKKN